MERKYKSGQGGFTLIELIAVIVILGILAATAIPKFLDLSTEAETAVAKGGVAAGLSALNLTFAKAVLADPSVACDATFVTNAKNNLQLTDITVEITPADCAGGTLKVKATKGTQDAEADWEFPGSF